MNQHSQIVVENTKPQLGQMPRFTRRTNQDSRIIVENHKQREMFQGGVRYWVTVGNCKLPNRVKASTASWLAYVALQNNLSFSSNP
jgi:hypothetical protein